MGERESERASERVSEYAFGTTLAGDGENSPNLFNRVDVIHNHCVHQTTSKSAQVGVHVLAVKRGRSTV